MSYTLENTGNLRQTPDVEVLLELRELMITELEKAGKTTWARQEFDHLLDFVPAVRQDAWRRTSGAHRLRSRRSLAAAKALWEARDEIAQRRDVTPGRVIPDSAIVAAAAALRWWVRPAVSNYGDLVEAAFHTDRFALYTALRLTPPKDAAEERTRGMTVTEYLRSGSDDATLTFTHPSSP